ncbi:fucolectin-3-like [Pelodytes ibericus]
MIFTLNPKHTVQGILGLNLARNGLASQSSEYKSIPGLASYAIDGDANGNYMSHHCSHTDQENGAWWEVNLKQVYKIATVVISNREDCCKDRLNGAEIRVGNSPDNNNPVCATITDSGSKILVCCNGMVGQYVSVVIPSRAEYLTLCEVEVYGEEIKQDPQVCW